MSPPLHHRPKTRGSRQHTAEVADAVEASAVNAVTCVEAPVVTEQVSIEAASGVASVAAIGVVTVVNTLIIFLTIMQ